MQGAGLCPAPLKQHTAMNTATTMNEEKCLQQASEQITHLWGNIEGEIYQLNDKSLILKLITKDNFWACAWLQDIGTICEKLGLIWWLNDTLFFKGKMMQNFKEALYIAMPTINRASGTSSEVITL